MTATGVLIGLTVWCMVAWVVSVILGAMIRRREREENEDDQ